MGHRCRPWLAYSWHSRKRQGILHPRVSQSPRTAARTASGDGERSSIALPLLQPNHHGSPEGGEARQDRGANLVAEAFEVHPLAGLGADNGDVLLTGPILGMLEQVRPELRLFRLEPFEFGANVGQTISGMTVPHLLSPI